MTDHVLYNGKLHAVFWRGDSKVRSGQKRLGIKPGRSHRGTGGFYLDEVLIDCYCTPEGVPVPAARASAPVLDTRGVEMIKGVAPRFDPLSVLDELPL